ncbi:MAG: hypothetical protein ACI9DM_000240 [Cyclobacteriaceae bacterium]|jgi:hypothetical protein
MIEIQTTIADLKKKEVEIFNQIKRRKKSYSQELYSQKDIFATEKKSDKLFEVKPSIEAGRMSLEELKEEYKNVKEKIKTAERSLNGFNRNQRSL